MKWLHVSFSKWHCRFEVSSKIFASISPFSIPPKRPWKLKNPPPSKVSLPLLGRSRSDPVQVYPLERQGWKQSENQILRSIQGPFRKTKIWYDLKLIYLQWYSSFLYSSFRLAFSCLALFYIYSRIWFYFDENLKSPSRKLFSENFFGFLINLL